MAASKPVDVPVAEPKAQQIGPGDPVEAPALSQMGDTFAERKKAREKAEKKAVSSSRAENKAVGSAESKRK